QRQDQLKSKCPRFQGNPAARPARHPRPLRRNPGRLLDTDSKEDSLCADLGWLPGSAVAMQIWSLCERAGVLVPGGAYAGRRAGLTVADARPRERELAVAAFGDPSVWLREVRHGVQAVAAGCREPAAALDHRRHGSGM